MFWDKPINNSPFVCDNRISYQVIQISNRFVLVIMSKIYDLPNLNFRKRKPRKSKQLRTPFIKEAFRILFIGLPPLLMLIHFGYCITNEC